MNELKISGEKLKKSAKENTEIKESKTIK